MYTDLPEHPILYKTLSEQHWVVAYLEMRTRGVDQITAGRCGEWLFKLVKEEGEVVRKTYREGQLIHSVNHREGII
jgi:hypothetical protein